MLSPIQHINDFGEYMRLVSDHPCIVKFTAPWCGPCKRIAPTFHKLAEEHGDNVKFLEVDIDVAADITNHEDVKSIPLFLFYQGGNQLQNLAILGCNENDLKNSTASLIAYIASVVEEPVDTIEGIVIPPSPKTLNMSRLSLDDIEESDDEENYGESVSREPVTEEQDTDEQDVIEDADEYGEDCDLPIEKTITEDMLQHNE